MRGLNGRCWADRCERPLAEGHDLCDVHLGIFRDEDETGEVAGEMGWAQVRNTRERSARAAIQKHLDGRPERERQEAIFKAVRLHAKGWGLEVFRANSGELQDEAGHFVRLAPAGTPDIYGGVRLLDSVAPGRVLSREIGLEVKSAKGKLRPSQREWAERAFARGAYFAVVHGPDEALPAIEAARRGEASPPLPPLPVPRARRKP